MKYYKFFAIPACTHKPLIVLKKYHMYDDMDISPQALQDQANLIGESHIDKEAPHELPIMEKYFHQYKDNLCMFWSDIKEKCIQNEFDGDEDKYNQAFELFLQDYYTHSIIGYKEVDFEEYQKYQDKGTIYECLTAHQYECWYCK